MEADHNVLRDVLEEAGEHWLGKGVLLVAAGGPVDGGVGGGVIEVVGVLGGAVLGEE